MTYSRQTDTGPAMRHLTVEGLVEFMSHHPRAKVLDVRSANERESGSILGNYPVPWFTPDWEPNPAFLAQTLQHCSPDDYVLVICRSGYRSYVAGALLENSGFQHIYNVLGGYEDLPRSFSCNCKKDGLEAFQPIDFFISSQFF